MEWYLSPDPVHTVLVLSWTTALLKCTALAINKAKWARRWRISTPHGTGTAPQTEARYAGVATYSVHWLLVKKKEKQVGELRFLSIKFGWFGKFLAVSSNLALVPLICGPLLPLQPTPSESWVSCAVQPAPAKKRKEEFSPSLLTSSNEIPNPLAHLQLFPALR